MKSVWEKRKRLGYMPIGYKLMLSYLVFIIILITVNGYVSHSMYDSSMRKQTRANIKNTLVQIRDNVTYKADDIIRISSTLYEDDDFIESLRVKLADSKEVNERYEQRLEPKLDSAKRSIGMNLRLFVYYNNPTIDEVYHNYDKPEAQYREKVFNLLEYNRIIHQPWYYSFPDEEYGVTMQWKQVEEDKASDRISMIRRIVDLSIPTKIEEIGMMRFSVLIEELFESVYFRNLGDGAVLLVKDKTGKIIYASNQQLHDAKEASERAPITLASMAKAHPPGEFLTLEEFMPRQDWTIVAYVPLTIIKQEAERVRTYILLLCLLCFILFTFTGIFMSRYFSKRITKFVSVLNAFREGDLHKRISYRGRDEFSQIATALNGMGEDVEALINKVYLTQLQKKEAELEMLQTQINPHFLYNTLSSINRLAKFGENEKLQKMVVELAKFYRLTLNSGRTLIPVSSEVEQVNAYLDIQKVKYGRRLEVTFDVDVNVWQYETIKLILQPFVENVLKHAWSGDRIHIRIVAKLDGGDILYRVIDDGMGVRQERIAEIMNASNESETGFGIRNIHQRVQLQYGEQYGVSIFSVRGAGTSVNVRIPARKRKLFLEDPEDDQTSS
ncbi:HAMP domain-containing protein [Paenibacillus sp. 1011MAR3C5]|uniref:sensor histidine kinase n=1 Tax=Paenibacillus sp. 1011MAR3C5 TaxID=1675787 RepID=UPI000E6B8F7C|nr:sensor histidine kinase [Paenibacillus sp. 1011MAR3C5]RJE84798.1 HAMP domain-containing protein [Paenibacillus sp. 1011MAR3C5]